MSVVIDFPKFSSLTISKRLIRDLRSDHAGETGAVYIYKGILSASKDRELVNFSRQHLKTEMQHLKFFDAWLPQNHKSMLLPLWRVSGYLLGRLPAMISPRWAYITIVAVETFVTKHYQNQIDQFIDLDRDEYPLKILLLKFQSQEGDHRDDAVSHLNVKTTTVEKIWQKIVGIGSHVSVQIARAM